MINYGDPDVIDNRVCEYYLWYILTWKVHLNFGPSNTCSHREPTIFVNTCSILAVLKFVWQWSPTLLKAVKQGEIGLITVFLAIL